MSNPQPISKHSNTSQTSPHPGINNGKEPVPNARQEPFNSRAQFNEDFMVLLRRFLVTSLSLVFLVITIWRFSKVKRLARWQQRGFNTLSILFPGMTSLALGSLIGHLGSMLRWPLLARKTYKMQDVDLILDMSPPTCSLRLIMKHIGGKRTSRTTLIVTLYLLTNILGRLSVALFGLAFNIRDEKGINYPILATNWTSALWTRDIYPSTAGPGIPKDYEIVEDWAFGNNTALEIGDINPDLRPYLSILNATLEVGTDIVEYSYDLKDFKQDYTRLSNHTVHSAVNCSLIEVEQGQYWRWNKWNRTGPFSWGEDTKEDSNEVVARMLWVSNNTDIEYPHWVSFAASSNASHAPSQIYILGPGFAWECWPTLTETIATKSLQPIQPSEQLFHKKDLYGSLGVRSETDSLGTDEEVTILLDGISNSPAQAAVDSLDIICNQNFSMPLNETVWNGYRLWVAAVAARLPILAIMHANTALPRVARSPHPTQIVGTAFTYKVLEVGWLRVGIITASITLGQLLAIGIVLSYCKGTYTRDDSPLATAELLKTVINKFDGGKLMTGEKLALSLDGVLGGQVSYGTRKGQDGGPPEVDLASGLDVKFPPFPPGQRF
ncbi:hypothetical protein B9Z19DRAFT_962480 [Tuber borchii]|uniref:Uncharacterized protein n=1 Tax=Tuber borchii TaxID=42251 RepID=A0A2T7A7S4_TUBBO|nr:hypothetical protein B9Z19DRAFT_962480 [Tuber borchii]